MRFSPLRLLAIGYPCISAVGQFPIGTVAGVTVSLERLVMLVLGPLCILQLAFAEENVRRIVHFTPRSIALGLLLWLTALGFSCAIHFEAGDTALLLGYAQKFLLGFLFACAVASEPDARRAVRLFALATLLAVPATFFVYYTQGSSVIRAAGFLSSDFGDITFVEGLARSGALGGIPLMACWLEAVFAGRPSRRILWYVGVAALFAAAMLALRREYVLSIAVCLGWGLFGLPLGLRRFQALAIVGGFFALGFAIIQIVPEWRPRLLSETVDTFVSGQDLRLLMLQTSPRLFAEEPLIGRGLGTFPRLMATSLPVRFASDEEATRFLAQGLASHNSFLTAALEAGVFGLLGLTIVFVSLGRWCWRLWRFGGRVLGSPLAYFAPLFFIQLLFSVTFQDGLASNIVWAFLGMSVAIVALERSRLLWFPPGAAKPVPVAALPMAPAGPPVSHVRNPRSG